MRLLICGGGTGGHIYPALALARYVLNQDRDAEILFVGTERGLESKIVPGAGFPLSTIPARGYQRSLKQLGPVFKELYGGLSQAKRIIRAFNPDVVLGTGGYVSAPVVLAAVLARRPTVIHEQNALPGLANRSLAPLVTRVCLSFEQSRRLFSRLSRIVLTGNPRASEAAAASGSDGRQRLSLDSNLRTVVVYGGSRGALKINKVMTEFIKSGWLPAEIQLVYITGEQYYQAVMDKLGVLPQNVRLLPYLNEMLSVLAAADLVVTRSGATTLAEITALGLPAILIPSPNVVNNHQYFNARLLSDAGAALLIEENEFNHFSLRRELEHFFSEPGVQESMARASREIGVTDASERLYRCLTEIVNSRSGKANTTR
jgi:UDP-N-acetylglucosamine--N-acetylmuramyl-(pentapeptide) pyrophosphoryl-undecaprenol N-acetylglucosamine transferase